MHSSRLHRTPQHWKKSTFSWKTSEFPNFSLSSKNNTSPMSPSLHFHFVRQSHEQSSLYSLIVQSYLTLLISVYCIFHSNYLLVAFWIRIIPFKIISFRCSLIQIFKKMMWKLSKRACKNQLTIWGLIRHDGGKKMAWYFQSEFFRLFLTLVSILTILCAYLWLTDPDTVNTSLYTSLRAHPVFFIRFVLI